MYYDLRDTSEDESQRMLNALEPGTIMPIHRHHASSETVVILRGRIRWIFYDENGNEMERVVLDADGDLRMLQQKSCLTTSIGMRSKFLLRSKVCSVLYMMEH